MRRQKSTKLMTKLNPTIGAVNVCFPAESEGNGVNHQYHNRSGTPIRFIPVEQVHCGTTGQVGWHGSTSEVFRTKSGKLLCSLTEWSCVDGEADDQTNIVASDEADLMAKLDGINGRAAEQVRAFLAQHTECVPTI